MERVVQRGKKEPKIKGLQFDYRTFLWRALSKIWQAETEGYYDLALHYTLSLIKYLPRWAKQEFSEEAEKIRQELRQVGRNVAGADFVVKDINRNKIRQRWARDHLKDFLDRLTSRLDEKGYLEIRYAPVEEGYSHTL